jgi:hypothetical protein
MRASPRRDHSGRLGRVTDRPPPPPEPPRPPALRGARLALALAWVAAVVLVYVAVRELRLNLGL